MQNPSIRHTLYQSIFSKIVLIILCLNYSFISAQNYNSKVFTSNDGLPSSLLFTSFQDHNGYLWIGTYGGISRFDGTQFRNFTLNDGLGCNQVLQLFEDKKGNLYAGTFFGMSIFDGQIFKNFDKIDNTSIERTRTIIQDSEGIIWGGCKNGIWSMTPKQEFKLYNYVSDSIKVSTVRQLYQIDDKHILVAARDRLFLFDRYKFTEIRHANQKPIPATAITKFNGKILIGTYGQGWFYYEKGNIVPFDYGSYNWFENQKGNTVAASSNMKDLIYHKFVIRTNHRGEQVFVAVSNTNLYINIGKNFYIINKNSGLPIDIMVDVEVDTEQNIWLSSHKGLIRLRENFVDKYTIENGLLNDKITFIGKDNQQNIYFVGGNDGRSDIVMRLRNGVFERVFQNIKFSNIGGVEFIEQDSKGNFWLADFGKSLIVVSPDGKTNNRIIQQKTELLSFKEDIKNNIIWLGGRGQLLKFQNNQLTAYPFAGDDINTMYIDQKNRLWLGARGLWYFDGRHFYDYSKQTNTENALIRAIEKRKDGTLWLGTLGKGVRKILLDDTPKLIEKINIPNGLTNENVLSLKFDNQDQLWVSSFGGILRMDIGKPKVNDKYPTRVFELNDGILNAAWEVAPLHKDPSGDIWLGTTKGVMRFRVKDIFSNKQVPKLFIDKLQLFQTDTDWAKDGKKLRAFTQLPQNLDLNYTQNFLTFHFIGISLSNPQNIYYSYKLDGLDEKWSPITQQNNINYSKLSAGNYTFWVKAMNSDGIWSEPISYAFTISPPFWQTWWFRAVLLVSLVAAIYVFLKNREKRIIERNKLDNQMTELKLKALQSQMNPHFLFNSLNSIQNYIVTNRGLEGAKYLSKFSKLVRRILDNSNHQYLSFESIIETLKMYIELESFRFNHEFKYEFDIEENETLLDTKLPPMLLQPHVENAIWHGLMPKIGEKRLIIKAFLKNDHIYCQIEDNGVGRGKKATKDGHISRGQSITSEIFDSLKKRDLEAKLEIIDLFDQNSKPIGTRVEMVIPTR